MIVPARAGEWQHVVRREQVGEQWIGQCLTLLGLRRALRCVGLLALRATTDGGQ